jgi:hypothetical protein
MAIPSESVYKNINIPMINNPLAYYRLLGTLDERRLDYSGSGRHLAWRAVTGSGALFNHGTYKGQYSGHISGNGYGSLYLNDAAFDSMSLTVMLMAYPYDAGGGGGDICIGYTNAAASVTSRLKWGLEFILGSSGLRPQVQFRWSSSNSNSFINIPCSLSFHKWNHIAITRSSDGLTLNAWINGAKALNNITLPSVAGGNTVTLATQGFYVYSATSLGPTIATKFPINSAIIWDTVLDDKLIEWYADIMRGHHVV